jgi:hypothetical protein
MNNLNILRKIIKEALEEKIEPGKSGLERLAQQGYLGDTDTMPNETSNSIGELKNHILFNPKSQLSDIKIYKENVLGLIQKNTKLAGDKLQEFSKKVEDLNTKYEKIALEIKKSFSRNVNPTSSDISDLTKISKEAKELLSTNSPSVLNDEKVINWYRLKSVR